jgi:hypothetical protein
VSNHLKARLVALVAAVALLGTACGALADPPAATVHGRAISEGRVSAEMAAIRDNVAFREEALQGFPVTGSSAGTFDAAFAARVLTLQIYYEMMERELERRDDALTDAEIDEMRDAAVAEVGGPEIFELFPEEYQQETVRRRALLEKVSRLITEDLTADDAARRYYDENRDDLERACARHILFFTDQEGRTEDEAEQLASEARSRILAGEEFADVATEVSEDTGSAIQGGSLGCQARGAYLPEFDEAVFTQDVGDVGEPVQTSVGFHVILVEERGVPSFEEAEDQIEQELQRRGQQAFADFLVEQSASGIDVNPRYGSWELADNGVGEVVPPEGPTTTLPPPPELPGTIDDPAARP